MNIREKLESLDLDLFDDKMNSLRDLIENPAEENRLKARLASNLDCTQTSLYNSQIAKSIGPDRNFNINNYYSVIKPRLLDGTLTFERLFATILIRKGHKVGLKHRNDAFIKQCLSENPELLTNDFLDFLLNNLYFTKHLFSKTGLMNLFPELQKKNKDIIYIKDNYKEIKDFNLKRCLWQDITEIRLFFMKDKINLKLTYNSGVCLTQSDFSSPQLKAILSNLSPERFENLLVLENFDEIKTFYKIESETDINKAAMFFLINNNSFYKIIVDKIKEEYNDNYFKIILILNGLGLNSHYSTLYVNNEISILNWSKITNTYGIENEINEALYANFKNDAFTTNLSNINEEIISNFIENPNYLKTEDEKLDFMLYHCYYINEKVSFSSSFNGLFNKNKTILNMDNILEKLFKRTYRSFYNSNFDCLVKDIEINNRYLFLLKRYWHIIINYGEGLESMMSAINSEKLGFAKFYNTIQDIKLKNSFADVLEVIEHIIPEDQKTIFKVANVENLLDVF